jgi:hypothetical protein
MARKEAKASKAAKAVAVELDDDGQTPLTLQEVARSTFHQLRERGVKEAARLRSFGAYTKGPEDPATPAELRVAVGNNMAYLRERRLSHGDAGHDDAMRDAAKRWYEVAASLRMKDPSLPVLPSVASDPLAGLDALRAWCSDAEVHDGVVRPSPDGQADGEDHALTKDHETILAELARTPQSCRTVIDVSGCGPIRNRETVGRLLRELSEYRLVERPHGPRKGYALTAAGKARTSVPSGATQLRR